MTAYYERLRQEVLDRSSGNNSCLGQAVLVNRGVVAWMHALGPCLTSLTAASPPKPPEAFPSAPGSVQKELVRLLGEAVFTIVSPDLS
jgi:hypothetical protein